MKKIFTMMALAVLVGSNAMAQEARGNGYGQNNDGRGNGAWQQQRSCTYYFYPYANVYYNPYTRDYWYQKNGRWVSNDRLPRYINLYNQQVVNVDYRDRDGLVWRDNFRHLQQYRYQQNGHGGHRYEQPAVVIDRH